MKCPQCDRSMQFSIGTVQQVRCDSCLDRWKCHIQSDETIVDSAALAASLEAETTSFVEPTSSVITGMDAMTNPIDTADAVTVAGLREFLSRPVRILNFTWAQSDSVGVSQTISPWNLFFNNTNIKYKLNNFAFLRANLHLKIVVNASPFLYGSMRACYQPLPAFKASTVNAGIAGGQSNSELIPYSQQPGAWIKPQCSEGAEIILPFFYPRAFLRAQVAQDFTDMGTLRMIIYNVLRSANGATGQNVSVQVFAWAEDVALAGPSVGLAMQADEYGVGPVSGPASTVASIAGKLRSVPIIGKFATATEMGAKAVAGIAKLFGFTNVPVIEPVQPYRPTAFPQLASTEIGYPVEKLTLDSKNELSIDPTTLGLPPTDELAIENFVSRQSYLVSSNWSTATTVDTPLFTSRVSPNMELGTMIDGSRIQKTPMSLVAKLFKSWRGDIIFTFRFIASPFHKGRVRISYDPVNAAVQTTNDTGPVVFNKIVDISEETEVDVRIPYQQALSWLYTYQDYSVTPYTTSASPTLTYTDTFDNGILSVKVLTLLTSPVSSSSVDMQVFVRGAENLEFANPSTVFQNETVFAVQSHEYAEERKGIDTDMGGKSDSLTHMRSRVNFGEVVGSLRVLLRRSNLVDVMVPVATTAQAGQWYMYQTRFPPYYGYDPGATFTAKGVLAPGLDFPCNFAGLSPWHYVANCFVAQRGSMHWHYNLDGSPDLSLAASRVTNFQTATIVGSSTIVPGTQAVNSNYLTSISQTGGSGSALTNQKTNAGLSISVPNYTAFKFQTTDPRNSTTPVSGGGRYDGSTFEMIKLTVTKPPGVDLSTCRLERYAAIGTDYNLHFFVNCPSAQYLLRGNIVPT